MAQVGYISCVSNQVANLAYVKNWYITKKKSTNWNIYQKNWLNKTLQTLWPYGRVWYGTLWYAVVQYGTV